MSFQSSGFASSTTFIGHKTLEILRKRAASMGLPVSKVIAFAIDNELDAAHPFNYPCTLPTTIYIENAYADEAQKLFTYLRKFPTGIGRETLVLNRRDYGVPSRETVMLAYRELLERDLIEEVPPPGKSKFKGYPASYRYTRIKNATPETFKGKKQSVEARREALKRELAKLEEETNDSE